MNNNDHHHHSDSSSPSTTGSSNATTAIGGTSSQQQQQQLLAHKKRARVDYENVNFEDAEDEDEEEDDDDDIHHRRRREKTDEKSLLPSSSSSAAATGSSSTPLLSTATSTTLNESSLLLSGQASSSDHHHNERVQSVLSPSKKAKLDNSSSSLIDHSHAVVATTTTTMQSSSSSNVDMNIDDEEDDDLSVNDDERGGHRDSLSSSSSFSQQRKTDEKVAPSRILFLRNLPPNCQQSEIEAVTGPYDSLEIVVLKDSKQAFVEFNAIENADRFLQVHGSSFHLRGRQVYVTYSGRQEIKRPEKDERPNNVLLATLFNVIYSITVDVLHQVFSRYGDVNKIVVFSKNNNTQALIQFADVQAATAAKVALDGQNIYPNCCKLRIVYSKMKDLNVKFNNDRTRDFTNPNLPNEPAFSNNAPPPSRNASSSAPPAGNYPHHQPFYPMAPYAGASHYAPYNTQPPMGGYGSGPETPVLYVRGINNQVTCDHLFVLFGVYGDVERVKILPPPKSAAMIEFTNPYGSGVALQYLSRGCPLYGSTLSVSRSKHYNINTPRSDSGEFSTDGQFKDFHNSPLHRFKRAGSKNYNHICAPSKSLHVSNIPGSATEDDIRNLFGQYGDVQEVRFFGNKTARTNDNQEIENKMAIVQLDNLDNAIQALVQVHGHMLNGLEIKVTFSEKRRNEAPRGPHAGHSHPAQSYHHHAMPPQQPHGYHYPAPHSYPPRQSSGYHDSRDRRHSGPRYR